jgi:hypothetical protein
MSTNVVKCTPKFGIDKDYLDTVESNRLLAYHLTKLVMPHLHSGAAKLLCDRDIEVLFERPEFGDHSCSSSIWFDFNGFDYVLADRVATEDERKQGKTRVGSPAYCKSVIDAVRYSVRAALRKELGDDSWPSGIDEFCDRAITAANVDLLVVDDEGRVKMPDDIDDVIGDAFLPKKHRSSEEVQAEVDALFGSNATAPASEAPIDLSELSQDDEALPDNKAPVPYGFSDGSSKGSDVRPDIIARSLLGDADELKSVSLFSLLLGMHKDGLTLMDVAMAVRENHRPALR